MSDIVREIRHVSGGVIVVVAGELTRREAPELHDSLIDICEQSPELLILNLAEVSFIDSSGVGTIADVFRRLKQNDGKLALVGMNRSTRSVFEITRLDQLMAIYDTEEEALNS